MSCLCIVIKNQNEFVEKTKKCCSLVIFVVALCYYPSLVLLDCCYCYRLCARPNFCAILFFVILKFRCSSLFSDFMLHTFQQSIFIKRITTNSFPIVPFLFVNSVSFPPPFSIYPNFSLLSFHKYSLIFDSIRFAFFCAVPILMQRALNIKSNTFVFNCICAKS